MRFSCLHFKVQKKRDKAEDRVPSKGNIYSPLITTRNDSGALACVTPKQKCQNERVKRIYNEGPKLKSI